MIEYEEQDEDGTWRVKEDEKTGVKCRQLITSTATQKFKDTRPSGTQQKTFDQRVEDVLKTKGLIL